MQVLILFKYFSDIIDHILVFNRQKEENFRSAIAEVPGYLKTILIT